MEAPPQFPGAPKKSKTGLILGGIALAIVLCCCGCGGAIFFFGRKVFGKAMGLVECSISMGQHRDALLGYAKAHGGKLPGAASWQNDVKPYLKPLPDQDQAKGIMTIPGPDADYCDLNGGTSITFNAALAGKKVADVKEQYGTVALFETPGKGRNRSAAYKEPPFASSPILFKGERRGWIRQPLSGQATYKDKLGRSMPAPTASGNASLVDVEPKTSKGE